MLEVGRLCVSELKSASVYVSESSAVCKGAQSSSGLCVLSLRTQTGFAKC